MNMLYFPNTFLLLGALNARFYCGLPVGFFCSSIQFYVLLSPYLCFISFLYPDLYVQGDDA